MYLLAVIGNEISDSVNPAHNDIFNYENRVYIKWIDVNFKQFILDVKKVPDFTISVNEKQLELYFDPARDTGEQGKHYKSRKRLCEQFLQKENGDMLYEPNLIELPPQASDLNHFYDLEVDLLKLYEDLKDAHRYDKISDEVPLNVQHSFLNPLLREYQSAGIRWMLQRELASDFLPSEFVAVKSIPEYSKIANDFKVFYYNYRTLELIDYKPKANKLPNGGILADEMGLGKTVEMLGLILLNPKRKRKFCEIDENEKITFNIPDANCNAYQNAVCLCRNSNMKKTKLLICCTKCLKYQHRKCVLMHTEVTEGIENCYICPSCWRNHELIESHATIIVSPVAIKLQWQNEIGKHIRYENFKVFIYNGVTETGWISPRELAKYDVVLTDYNVLKSEIYFANSETRSGLRFEKKFLNPVSPLPLINWWRVCLDESQIVETPTNLCSKMVKSLATTHRWAITGTPVEKKIDNLYGLLYFLDCYPYTDLKKWSELSRDFRNGNNKPLVKVLRKIMWRTCKNDVLDQINIPPQTTLVHYVILSDVESFFYKSQHENYSTIFKSKALKIKNNLTISKLDPHTLKLLMEPLRKIRQDCTIPSIFQKNVSNSSVKKFLKPKELLDVLIVNNENDCKSELRSIISSLNGLAGIYIIRKEFDCASKLYKSIIRRAKEQEDTNVTVDTLQQIHATYNLIQIANAENLNDRIDPENLRELHDKLSKLEAKYIDSYYILVKQCENQLEITRSLLIEINGKVGKNWENGNWITNFINEIDQEHEMTVINRIRLELQTYTVTNDISSFYGLQYVLLIWWAELVKSREDLVTQFQNLDYFIKNINKTDLSAENSLKIKSLIKSAFDCHLKRVPPTTKPKRCQICKLKMRLLKYECFVFDKRLTKTSDENIGTWNPTYQEYVLKIILNCLQNRNSDDTIKIYEQHMEMIDLFKKEFKEYSKFWVEVNYLVSAFDELNMCKSRLQIMDPAQINKENRSSKNIISIYDVDDVLTEFEDQLKEGELNFVKCLGRIKYLKHLKEKAEPDVCPICTKRPENKYFVLQCGHIMCEICLTQMKMFQRSFLICCICRNKQTYNEVFSITCKPENIDDSYTGDYSTKIEAVVRKVLELLANDDNVKIIIFSQWIASLAVISKALAENNVAHRLKSNKIQSCLNDFKNPTKRISCLLLPLQFGAKGLNLIEATHIFLVEPILNPGEELQAVGRIHRIGQTQNTFVHKFIVRSTIEETIYKTITNDQTGKWRRKNITIENLQNLFALEE